MSSKLYALFTANVQVSESFRIPDNMVEEYRDVFHWKYHGLYELMYVHESFVIKQQELINAPLEYEQYMKKLKETKAAIEAVERFNLYKKLKQEFEGVDNAN